MSKIKLLLNLSVFSIFLCQMAQSEKCFVVDHANAEKVTVVGNSDPNQNCSSTDPIDKNKIKTLVTDVPLSSSDLNGFTSVTEFIVKPGTNFRADREFFKKLPHLERVELNNTQVHTIADLPFENNSKLNFLSLAGNLHLEVFDFKIFSSPSIEVILPENVETVNINCKKTSCRFSPEGESLGKLKSFNASDNQVDPTKMLRQIGSSLQQLDLSGNKINEWTNQLLEPFKDLSFLSLSNAKITKIEPKPFAYQVKLETLDLSGLRLKKIDTDLFDKNFNQIKTLKLDNNQLTNIDIITKEKFKQLVNLIISRNAFLCSYLEKFLKEWNRTLNFIEIPTINPANGQINVNGAECRIETNEFPWAIVVGISLGTLLIGSIASGVTVWWVIRRRSAINSTGEDSRGGEQSGTDRSQNEFNIQILNQNSLEGPCYIVPDGQNQIYENVYDNPYDFPDRNSVLTQ